MISQNIDIFFAGDSRAAGIQEGTPYARWPALRSRWSAKLGHHLYRAPTRRQTVDRVCNERSVAFYSANSTPIKMNYVIQSASVMSPIRTIIVFGDLTYDYQRDFQQLIHVKGNANLAEFLTRVSFAFRHEFASLPQLEQEWLPKFTELADLLDNVNMTEGAPAVRFALFSVYQIGRFIR